MATTTNYGWTTPDDTDLVKDGASAIRTLGTSVDTTTKALNPSTTLGDIEYRSSTANTNTRLGIGSTGQVLTVSGGVPSWATSSSGGMTLLSTTTLGSTQTTISSISQSYNQLLFICTGFTWSTGSTYVVVNPNSVATSTEGVGVFHDTGNPARVIQNTELLPFTNVNLTSSASNAFYILISNYTATTYKPINYYGYTTSVNAKSNMAGVSKHAAAITSMQFTTAAGTATIGGTVLTYGVK
jgi:hypothetical protein